MKTLLKKEKRNEKEELMSLLYFFKKFFMNKVDERLFMTTYSKLCLYIWHRHDINYLENFVKEYFKLRSVIVDNRNSLIDEIKSESFNQQNFINKLRIKKQLSHWQKLCDNINKFEKEFHERVNISLLRVENERWSREQSENREQVI